MLDLLFRERTKLVLARTWMAVLAVALSSGNSVAGSLEDENRKIVTEFYELSFIRHQPTEAARTYFGDVYIQHNARVPNGAAPFYSFFERYFKDHPTASAEIKRVIADGDLVAIHSHSRMGPEDRGRAIVDIFRVENKKIVEHWDVVQDVPERSANGNTMFEGTNSR